MNTILRILPISIGVIGSFAACSSAPPESSASGDTALAQAPNGDVALTFRDTSEQRSQGEWDACRGKADCARGEGIVGLSEIPGGENRTALCRALGGQFSGNVTAKITLDARQDVRRAARAGDWAPNYFKLECGENEYVVGVSEDAAQCQGDRRVHALLCASASGLSDSCRTRVFDGGDDRGTIASGDWDVGAFKGECGGGEYVAGVSVDPQSGRAHSILCCGIAGGGGARFDALDYMRNTHGGTLHGTDGSIVAFSDAPGNRFYYVKGGSRHNDGRTFERYAYDGANVWLERDTSWPLRDGGNVYDAYDCVDPDTHAYGSFTWAKRSWADGEGYDYRTQIIGFQKAACGWSSGLRNATNTGHRTVRRQTVDFGGSIGRVDAIGIEYGPCETHWYARGWGWVKWEYHDVCGNRPGPDVLWNSWQASETHAPAEACGNAPLPFTGQ